MVCIQVLPLIQCDARIVPLSIIVIACPSLALYYNSGTLISMDHVPTVFRVSMLSRAQFQKCNLRIKQTGRRMGTVAAVSQEEGPTFVPRKKGVSDGAWRRCNQSLLAC